MKKLMFILLLMFLVGCAEQVKEPAQEKEALQNVSVVEEQNVTNSGLIKNNESETNKSDSEKIKADTPSVAICKKIPLSKNMGSDDKYYCLAVVTHNSGLCGEIGVYHEDDNKLMPDETEINNGEDDLENPINLCLAISRANVSYCKKMTSPESKKTCYNVLAQTSGNINVCSEIDYGENDKQQCYFNYVNALYWEDKSDKITAEDCDKVGIDQSSQDKDTCLAFKERDVSICGSNKNCLTFFKQDMSFCNGATFKDEEECIRDRAMTNRDISICGTLSEQTRRDDCYGDFSSHILPSTDVCDKIIDEIRRQGCYIDLAINLAKK